MAGLLTVPPLQEAAIAAALREWASEPFDWVHANCGLSVLDYVEKVRGRIIVPSPRRLGIFGVASILGRPAGLETYSRECLARLECPVTASAGRGDVGLVDLPESGPTMCIALGGKWAARGARSIVVGHGNAIVAWRVRCPRR